MNNRANIMYFIEHLCSAAQRENHLDFVRMMQRDILRVVDAVAPSDGTGAANVKVVQRVLQGLQSKGILMAETVQEIEACLKERDSLPGGTALSPLSPNVANGGAGLGLSIGPDGQTDSTQSQPSQHQHHHQQNQNQSQQERGEGGKYYPNNPNGSKASGGADALPTSMLVANATAARVDKRQIEQRIEEDRERHKRLRESIWAVGEDGHGAEFDRLWEEASDIGEDDFLAAEEDAGERRVAAEMS